jgi:hypothetical protein
MFIHKAKPSLSGKYTVKPEPIQNFININSVQNDAGNFGNLQQLVTHNCLGSVNNYRNNTKNTVSSFVSQN